MADSSGVKYEREMPTVLKALADVHSVIDQLGFDRKTYHLVQLRASQINRCGFCIDMHKREALADGESSHRLEELESWSDGDDFSAPERAALAWTEALTVFDPQRDLHSLRSDLRRHFSEKEIAGLTANIAMINLWNRINISRE